jgi:hypothetical protein
VPAWLRGRSFGLLFGLLFGPLFAGPAAMAAVYDSGEAIYASQPGALFRPSDRFTASPFVAPDERDRLTYYWEGVAADHPHRAVGRGTQFSLDGSRFSLDQAIVFPGEPTEPPTLGADSRIYLGSEYACVEIAGPSDPDGPTRTHVYLLQLQPANQRQAYRLPSLSGSCLRIWRSGKDAVTFFQTRYRYRAGSGEPAGLTLQRYRLRRGRFEKIDKPLQADFPVPRDTRRFSLPD